MTRYALLAFAALALVTACATSPTKADRMMAMCPMGVADTQVSVVDEVDGSTLTFTSRTQPAELQRRVHQMVDRHDGRKDGRHGGGMGLEGRPEGHGHGLDHEAMRATRATVLDVADGASVRLTPNDPADLAKVQASVRAHADRMQHHACGMMGATHGS